MKPIALSMLFAIALTLSVFCLSAAAEKKSCEELKTEIAAKLDGKGVKNYTLAIVGKDEVKDEKVVGSCEGGEKRITYTRK